MSEVSVSHRTETSEREAPPATQLYTAACKWLEAIYVLIHCPGASYPTGEMMGTSHICF